ncbi:MAG: hypothetical protein PHN22_03445 [Candidatus ainarchaeum sp.]|nr:hypothetical protein [Candidatus ainarchaeum sp.]
MYFKMILREDLNKIYFIFTKKNIILDYKNKDCKKIYNKITKIRYNKNLYKIEKNKIIIKIIEDIIRIYPKSKFFLNK